MRTIVVEEPGSSQSFVEINMDKPAIKADEVLIEIHSTALNPVDIAFRTGKMEMDNGFPAILGVDIAGVVAEVGDDVTDFEVGDSVFTSKPLGTDGGFAEYVAVSEDFVVHKPEELSFEEAASLGIAALTAYQLVNLEDFKIKEGEKVLIQSGSGGVGTFAIQFAKQNGAYIIATTSRNEKLLETLGVNEVVNYKEIDVVKEYEHKVDMLIDTAGLATETLPVVKENGRALTIVTDFDEEEAAKQNISTKRLGYRINKNQLELFAKQVANNELTVVIDEVFSFTVQGIQMAHKALESGHASGKIIIKIKG